MAAGPVTPDELMTIGEFSRRCRLPASTLRYYHERGLLVPAHVDRATGYRYYRRAQLVAAALVGELRRAGISPAVIGRITNGDADAAVALADERARIETEMRDRAASLSTIDRILSDLTAPGGTYTVTIQLRPALLVPAIGGEVDGESAVMGIQRLIVQLRKTLRAVNVDDAGPYGAVFPLDMDVDPIPVTVFAAVALAARAAIDTVELPAGRFATSEHVGDHQLGPAYVTLLDQIGTDGGHPTGPVIEEYLGSRQPPRTRIAIGLTSV
jgi:DNA-binding transcriptional MerR regulator/effector-binding domain-containing protein